MSGCAKSVSTVRSRRKWLLQSALPRPHLASEARPCRADRILRLGRVSANVWVLEQSIPDRFERQVERCPQRLAIETGCQELTYDDMNKAANWVAHAIIAECGKREEAIALLLEKGAPLIAAILGVLKAGKTYVPLNPAYPRAGISYIVQDSRANLTVTNTRNLALAHD